MIRINGEYLLTDNVDEINKHLKSGIIKVLGLYDETESICFLCKDGYTVQMYHCQDCCEYVRLYEDDCLINGTDIFTDCDWCEMQETIKDGDGDDYGSSTWTYYNFKTNKGYDNMRWLGESNGYYSESVDFNIYKTE